MNEKINLESIVFSPEEIKFYEKKYNAQYICDSSNPILEKDQIIGWHDNPCAFFWSPIKHPKGSNYFCLFTKPNLISPKPTDLIYIADGISIVNQSISAISNGEEIIFSRYRHDYRTFSDPKYSLVAIDGGRDYTRLVTNSSLPIKQYILMLDQTTNKLSISSEIKKIKDSELLF